jgi:hypothetical protein
MTELYLRNPFLKLKSTAESIIAAQYKFISYNFVDNEGSNAPIMKFSALAVVLWYHTCLISKRLPVRFPAGRTKNFSLHTAAVTSPTA